MQTVLGFIILDFVFEMLLYLEHLTYIKQN